MKSLKFTLIFILSIPLCGLVYSQGCSDAGFCTIPTIKSASPADSAFRLKNHLKLGSAYGIAQYGVSVITPYVEYNGELGNKISTAVKVLYGIHAGDLALTHGLADIIASVDYQVIRNAKVVLGIKVPFNRADKKKDGLPLPMAYQTSLGTTDIILGIAVAGKYFSLTTAWQQPFIQNKNEFLPEEYPIGLLTDNYIPTRGFQRKGDVLLRVSHIANFRNNKLSLISGILPIYHLGNDTYVDSTGQRFEIYGSKGLTLNLNLFLQYKLNESNSIEISAGAPIISREVRPDGLNQFSIGVEYVIHF
jgi:hypothetical protein